MRPTSLVLEGLGKLPTHSGAIRLRPDSTMQRQTDPDTYRRYAVYTVQVQALVAWQPTLLLLYREAKRLTVCILFPVFDFQPE
jgi:hypothetical protein